MIPGPAQILFRRVTDRGLGLQPGLRVFLEQFGHSGDQYRSSKRLLDEKCLLDEFLSVLLVFQITAHVDDLDLGLQGFQPLGEFGATHSGHDEIGQECVDVLFRAFRQGQGFGAVAGR